MAGETYSHLPVLLEEVIEALNIRADGVYIDGTYGRGGHAWAILQRLGPKGRLIAMDKDPEAVAVARENHAQDARVEVERGTFAMLERLVQSRHLQGQVDGILLDLGVSSPQLDDASRGFSFSSDGPLDMRMDPDSGISAAAWLANAKETEIAEVLKEYGEERHAKRIARAIVAARTEAPITTTRRLAEIVSAANASWEKHKHPATRSFQAIRIFINRELDDLREVLAQAQAALVPGGRLAVISFHSLEDRIVKRFLRDAERGPQLPARLPVMPTYQPTLRAIGKAITAGEAELARNPRARSAVLRIAERPA